MAKGEQAGEWFRDPRLRRRTARGRFGHNSSVLLYRLLSPLLHLAYAPWAFLRAAIGRKRLGDVRGRLGRAAYPDLAGGIWIHAVSVGEVGVARNLIEAIVRAGVASRVGLSVTTAAGRELASRLFAGRVPVFAFPFDLAGPVETALAAVRPGLVVFVETEIWPLFLERAAERGVATAFVNGRLSARSAVRYRLVRRFLARRLSTVALFAMQSAADAERLAAIGAPADRVRVAGNLKYDLPEPAPFADAERLRALAAGRAVVVAGSTAEGEEEAVLRAWRDGRDRALLALAPRRPERFDEAADAIAREGLVAVRRSRGSDGDAPATRDAVYLLDSIGELASLYAEARLAFVGGSLAPVGGHNPIEAWAAGVPVVVGPHTENFRAVVADGLARGLLRRVGDEAGLRREIAAALDAPDVARAAGDRARRFVAENRGAADRTAALLAALLAPSSLRRTAP